jgi:hypothetical protein
VITLPQESSEDEAASDLVSTIVIGDETFEGSTDNEASKIADSIELSEFPESSASDTTETTETPEASETPETPKLAVASLSTLTLEQATEQISPEILKTLFEQFNGSLENIRPVNRDDHLF